MPQEARKKDHSQCLLGGRGRSWEIKTTPPTPPVNPKLLIVELITWAPEEEILMHSLESFKVDIDHFIREGVERGSRAGGTQHKLDFA